MAIEANFNKIVYLNKFNNYFNRKNLRGNSLKDYFYNKSGEDVNLTITFGRSKLINFDPENDCYLRGELTGIPYGLDISVLSVEINNGIGNLTWDEYWGIDYHPDTRKLFLKFDTTAESFSDIPADIEIVISIYFKDRIFKIDENINFNPNDDIAAEILSNDISFHPDFLLVLDNENNIISRWFVIHDLRARNGQYKFQLQRDIISDYLSEILTSPVFVQKGMLEETDLFVVNNEGMRVNQIKTNETRLFDGLGKMAWAVLYIAKNTPDTETTASSVKIKISSGRANTFQQNFDIVAIPFLDFAGEQQNLTIIKPDGTDFETSSILISSNLSEICKSLGNNLYDVQILPYCPVPDCITGNLELDLRNLLNPTEGVGFDYILNNTDQIGVCIYIQENSFETDIFTENNIEITTSLSKKEASNLQLFRFVSPNYQGQFDFNIGKNNKECKNIKAYCSYKPYTPFIKVAPEFNEFYGDNFKDARGLICGGDFSIGAISDAWINFQLNNKNYQNIFNREIQNMDFEYSIEMRNQIISGTVGVGTSALTGAAAGAVAGSIVPGIGTAIGAAAGAIGGTLTSGIGMAVDTITMAQRYKENKDLAIDKFNYQLGNIKALPYTITKVSSIDYISKIWPFVEEYNCTDEELDAFREKIKYESMTVMRIDKMINYYHKFDDLCYFKGELIRNTEIAADYHILEAIYLELLKGVYI